MLEGNRRERNRTPMVGSANQSRDRGYAGNAIRSSPSGAARAVRAALAVGTDLSRINRADVAPRGKLGPLVAFDVTLTDLAPFPVSTFSSL